MNPLITKRCSPIEEAIYQDGFQAGAASRDAEIQRLQMALADAEALELGTAEKCDQLRAELEAARAEIERLKTVPVKYRRMAFNAHLQDENAKLSKQLAAEQAKNTGLRDALKSAVDTIEWMYGCTSPADDEVEKAIVAGNNALSTPSDTSALEAMIAKAGEVMRERCIAECAPKGNEDWECGELRGAEYSKIAIHTLPGVTLEDLK